MLAPDPRFEQIDAMTGLEFEAAVADLLRLLEYEHVQRTETFDKGADIVAVREGQRIAVEAKRWSKPVDLKAVRQLVDGLHQYDCASGLLVTNNYLTTPAIECAESWDVEVWDRRTLADYLDGDAPEIDTTVCAECGEPVTAGVTDWCLDHRARYGGYVLCRKHQVRSS